MTKEERIHYLERSWDELFIDFIGDVALMERVDAAYENYTANSADFREWPDLLRNTIGHDRWFAWQAYRRICVRD